MLAAGRLSAATKARLVLLDPAKRHPADRWTWVALVYAHGRMTSYVDGVLVLSSGSNETKGENEKDYD